MHNQVEVDFCPGYKFSLIHIKKQASSQWYTCGMGHRTTRARNNSLNQAMRVGEVSNCFGSQTKKCWLRCIAKIRLWCTGMGVRKYGGGRTICDPRNGGSISLPCIVCFEVATPRQRMLSHTRQTAEVNMMRIAIRNSLVSLHEMWTSCNAIYLYCMSWSHSVYIFVSVHMWFESPSSPGTVWGPMIVYSGFPYARRFGNCWFLMIRCR